MLTIGNVFALGESGTIDRSEPSKKRFGLSDGIDFRWYSCDKTLGNSNAWTCLGMRLRHAWVFPSGEGSDFDGGLKQVNANQVH